MKLLDSYGVPVVSYEGLVSLGDGTEEAESEGYFEAAQALDGKITIACFWPKVVPISTGVTTTRLMAADTEGWELRAQGDTFWLDHNVKVIQGTPMTYAVGALSRLQCSKIPDHRAGNYLITRFTMANLVFGQLRKSKPNPESITVGEWGVTLKPVDAYVERSEALRSRSGIEHTAYVEVKRIDGDGHSLNDSATFMDTLVRALRLWSGNKIDWIYGEGLDDSGHRACERIHKHGVVGPYSNILSATGWTVNLQDLVKAYFSSNNPLGRSSIADLVDYFVDVCGPGSFLEMRALSAATLLDAITQKLVILRGVHEALPKAQFDLDILPKLRDTIDGIGLDKEIKEQLKGNIQGAFRKSFRRRLRELSDQLRLSS